MKKTFLDWISSLGKTPTKEVKKEVVKEKPPCICQEIWKNQGSGFCRACNTSWI